MTSAEDEKKKFGLGDKIDKYMPLVKSVREKAKSIEGEGRHEVTLECNDEEFAGKLSLPNGTKHFVTFDSDQIGILSHIDIKNYESSVVIYIHKPDVKDGITEIRVDQVPNNGEIRCEFFNGMLSRYIDLVHTEKSCCFLGSGGFTKLNDEDFEVLLQEAKELYKRNQIVTKSLNTIDWKSVLPFANLANNILSERKSRELKCL